MLELPAAGPPGGIQAKMAVALYRGRGFPTPMAPRCGFCYWSEESKTPLEGWQQAMQGFLDRQPHPGRIDGLIPCDLLVFEDDSWFALVEREPIAEGHLRLVCKEHIRDLAALRGPSPDGPDPALIDAARATLLDDLIIASEVVKTFDRRVRDVVIITAPEESTHLHFDLIPRFRLDHEGWRSLSDIKLIYDDLALADKRRLWEENRRGFADVARKQREAAAAVIGSRPGRRRAGLRSGDERP